MMRTLGLNSLAASGLVALEIVESIEEPVQFELEITLPKMVLQFELADLNMVLALDQFLQDHMHQTTLAHLQLGTFFANPVTLVKDNEFPDRFFMQATDSRGTSSIHLDIDEPVVADFLKAARELAELVRAGTEKKPKK